MDHTKTFDNQPKIWCLITQRDDICYSFKFKEDSKGQEVLDEVNISFFDSINVIKRLSDYGLCSSFCFFRISNLLISKFHRYVIVLAL